jgi:hypothetical protein
MFNHIPIKTPIIETAHVGDKHFYHINGKKYPSITTILHSFPNPGIEIWKSKTPNWREIQQESFNIGTSLHSGIEQYLNNTQTDFISPEVAELFLNLKPELDKINNIQALETRLYDDNMGVAGTVDCIAEVEEIPSIIDFKNSRKKKAGWMVEKSGYYLQINAYARMWKYCTGEQIDNGVIMIANWDGSTSKHKIYIPDYDDKLNEFLYRYNELQRE